METLEPDLCVIGAGSGGLSVAAGAVQMGASVVLVEGGRMGGDCLNYGCVPSKALIAAAASAQAHRASAPLGVAADEPGVDYAAVMDHVHAAIAAIAPHDSQERFERLGVTVLRGWARFVSGTAVEVDGRRIQPRRFVIATGSSPSVPGVPGLDQVPYLTNETLWENRQLPGHLLILGGGPIGIEMAQAHRRLGSRVTVLEADRPLPKDDPELAAIVLDRLRDEGVKIRERARVARISGEAGAIRVDLEGGEAVEGTHLLVAAGRRVNLDRLDPDAGGIVHDGNGVRVDSGLRSVSNRKVYAVGDAAGGMKFTHLAAYHAGLVVRNALFRLPVRAKTEHIPWTTYTDPELAHVGLTEAEARERHGAVEVHRAPLSANDRAVAIGRTQGMVKLVAGRGGRILGASIVAPDAGEMIQLWAFATASGRTLSDVAQFVAPYPTLGEASKRAAGAYYQDRLFASPWVRRAVRFLARFG